MRGTTEKMKKDFVNSWKRSVQPRKQRKFRTNAPLHTKRKFMAAPLSKELRQKHKTRTMMLRKGDKVKITRGKYKGTIGVIDYLKTKKERVYITNTERTRTDSTKSLYPVHPSKVIIQELVMDDKRRKAIIERRGKH